MTQHQRCLLTTYAVLCCGALCAVLCHSGHRVQHEVAFLWKFHAKHHAIDTPSPFSTLFIHPLDATLQVRGGK